MEEIRKALKRSTLGLFMVSPHSLTSSFIRKEELSPLLKEKKLFPVGLVKLNLKDLRPVGLDSIQLFRLKEEKFYSELKGREPKEDFAEELAEKIVRRIERDLVLEEEESEEIESASHKEELKLEERVEEALKQSLHLEKILVPPRAKRGDLQSVPEESGDEVNAFKAIKEWALHVEGSSEQDSSPPLVVVLGEYGMGKTTLTRWLTQELIEERKKGNQVSLPIYFDLRNLSKEVREQPKLENILEELVKNWWKSGGVKVKPEEIIQLVRSGQAIAIFDGLDEVLVYLDDVGGRRFVRELWSIAYESGELVGRVVMTTRSHYFRTIKDAVSYFRGEDREDFEVKDYLTLFLLPFNEEQIRTYFEKSFADNAQVERAMELIQTVHNLEELAKRPYLLKLIRENLQLIEEEKAEGRRVSAARFYELVVESWIKRDLPKHQILPQHKRLFMEHLAAALWESGARSWHVDQVEDWFIEFLEENPGVRRHYGELSKEDLERLKEDFRTATFIVHDGVDHFRFAHTSLQEFFLASYLLKAIENEQYDRWNLRVPSPETFDFLAQLWRDHRDREQLFKNARIMGQSSRPRANANLVRFFLFARERYPEFETFSFARFDLRKTDLRGLELGTLEPDGPKVNWVEARFDGAKLRETRFTNANLERASFAGADLTRAEFWRARLYKANFEGANLSGTFFRESDLRNTCFEAAHFHRAKWIRSQLSGARGLPEGPPRGFFARNEGLSMETIPKKIEELVFPQRLGSISAMSALSEDLLAVGDSWGNVVVWDVRSGEEVFKHRMPGPIEALAALSEDLLAVGDGGGNVVVLDVRSGEKVFEEKMPGSVLALAALSEDLLAVGDGGGNVVVLDVRSGEKVFEEKMPGPVRTLVPAFFDHIIMGDWKGNIISKMTKKNGKEMLKYKLPGAVLALTIFFNDRLAITGEWGQVCIVDLKTGKLELGFVRAPDGEYLSFRGHEIVAASPCAWRWAYVRGRAPKTNYLEVYPYETIAEFPAPPRR